MCSISAKNPFNTLRISQQTWASTARIQHRQSFRLQQLVQHAYQFVPYYKKLFNQAGIHPDDIQTADDLSKIPITTRRDLQSRAMEERIPQGIPREELKGQITSGTTGEPLMVLVTHSDTMVNNALSFRALIANGMKPRHRKMSICDPRHLGKDTSISGRLGLYLRTWISVQQSPEEWIKALRSFRPHYIMGNCMTFSCLAEAIQPSDLQHIQPRCIMSTGGFLEDSNRACIEKSINAPVRDIYASWEAGMMAWECGTCQGYHLNTDWCIVEILKDGKPVEPGETGEVVITNLHSFGMPFIRYRQGDIAKVASTGPVCKCQLPLMERVYGRSADIIKLSDGQLISPHQILGFMSLVNGIHQWQLKQTTSNHCQIDYVPAADFPPDEEKRMKHELEKIFKQQIQVSMNKKTHIARHPDRKFRLIQTLDNGKTESE